MVLNNKFLILRKNDIRGKFEIKLFTKFFQITDCFGDTLYLTVILINGYKTYIHTFKQTYT